MPTWMTISNPIWRDDMSMTKGTPCYEQLAWCEKRIAELEQQLADLKAENERLRQENGMFYRRGMKRAADKVLELYDEQRPGPLKDMLAKASNYIRAEIEK